MDPKTLRDNLIGSIADDLRDDELKNFQDQAIERSRFSPRQGSKKPTVAPPPPGKTVPDDSNTLDLLTNSVALENAKKAGIPGPLAEAIAAAGRQDSSTVPQVIRQAAQDERGIKAPVPRQWMRHTEPDVKLYFDHRFDLLRDELQNAKGNPDAIADVQRRMSELDQMQKAPNNFKQSVGMVGNTPTAPNAPAPNVSGVPDIIRRAIGIPDTDSAGTAHGSTGASVEELARGERFFKVNGRNGQLTYQGVSPDANLQPGEAVIAIGKDGQMRVQGSKTGLSDADIIRKFGAKVTRAADPRNISQVTLVPDSTMAVLNTPVFVVHPDGTPGTVPRKNLERALEQGYTLDGERNSLA
jgi:hypothetical protein